jgi:hypothetical protein
VDTKLIARKVADQLIAHRDSLAGKAEDAHRAYRALDTAARAITEHRDDHKTSAAIATSHWNGTAASGFDRRARKMTTSLDVTATAAGKGATIVNTAATSLDGDHKAVVRLVEEYTTKASAALDAGLAVKGAGSHAALVRAVGQVVDLVRSRSAA